MKIKRPLKNKATMSECTGCSSEPCICEEMIAEDKPREFRVPESCLFESVDQSFEHYPDDAVTFMVSRYDYDLLKHEADKLAEALGRAKRIIDDMNGAIIGDDYSTEWIDEELKDYRSGVATNQDEGPGGEK